MNDDQPPSSKIRGLLRKIIGLLRRHESKQDLRDYLQEAQDNHIIDNEEANMIAGVLSVSEQRVRNVMLPKSKMVTVNEDMTFDQIVNLVIDSGHSRFPVARDNDIIGVLLAKDLLGIRGSTEDFSILQLMRPLYHIPESKPLNVILHEFRLHRLHMAIVTSEYGNVAGLITIEDVIEKIIGEIDDEHDSEDNHDIQKVGNDKYLVSALTKVADFNAYFHTRLDIDASDTIGGFVLSNFGYVPKVGESVEFAGLNFTVTKANDRRILDLLVNR